jgi:hypothetical protein
MLLSSCLVKEKRLVDGLREAIRALAAAKEANDDKILTQAYNQIVDLRPRIPKVTFKPPANTNDQAKGARLAVMAAG